MNEILLILFLFLHYLIQIFKFYIFLFLLDSILFFLLPQNCNKPIFFNELFFQHFYPFLLVR
jgi:hypothetical protein